MDSKCYQYLYKNLKSNVVGIVGMDRCSEIHISNKYGNLNVWLDWEFEPWIAASLERCSTTYLPMPISIHGPSRQTSTFLTLQNLSP